MSPSPIGKRLTISSGLVSLVLEISLKRVEDRCVAGCRRVCAWDTNEFTVFIMGPLPFYRNVRLSKPNVCMLMHPYDFFSHACTPCPKFIVFLTSCVFLNLNVTSSGILAGPQRSRKYGPTIRLRLAAPRNIMTFFSRCVTKYPKTRLISPWISLQTLSRQSGNVPRG